MKTDILTTPGKRRFDDMASENRDTKIVTWPTPSTGASVGDVFTTPSANASGRGLFGGASLATPAETPTPIRYKDLPATQDSELAAEILASLRTHKVSLPADGEDAVRNICKKHVLYTRGIIKGRDVSRTMVKKRDEIAAELQGEIEGLKAERETNKAVIRHLRRDISARKDPR